MNGNITLGKKAKILHLNVQKRTLIEKAKKNQREGNTAFTYEGYLFPEVKKFFEDQDYQVRSYDYPEFLLRNGGMPLHIFLPKDSIILTEEEMSDCEKNDTFVF